MEKHIIAASVRDRYAFEAFDSRGIETELTPPAQIVFQSIRKFYETDTTAKVADLSLILEYVKLGWPKQYDKLTGVLSELPDTSTSNVVSLWLAKKRESIGKRLSVALVDPNREADVEILLDEYNKFLYYEEDSEPSEYTLVSAVQLVEEELNGGRIPFYPACINKAIGGGMIRPSNVGLMGVPEDGKTAIAINACARLMMNGHKVVYFCNEEHPKRTLLRFISRLAGMDIDDVRARPQEAHDTAVANGYENLIMWKLKYNNMAEIEQVVDKHRPVLFVIDQLRNMNIKGCEGITQVLERGGQVARRIENDYNCIGILITQAGDSAYNKPILEMNDAEYSNVGYPATLDLFIGVGSNEDLRMKGLRVLTIIKNKFSGIRQAFTVEILPQQSKIRSVDS